MHVVGPCPMGHSKEHGLHSSSSSEGEPEKLLRSVMLNDT